MQQAILCAMSQKKTINKKDITFIIFTLLLLLFIKDFIMF